MYDLYFFVALMLLYAKVLLCHSAYYMLFLSHSNIGMHCSYIRLLATFKQNILAAFLYNLRIPE